MAAILHMTFSKCIFVNESHRILSQIPLKNLSKRQDNNSSFFHVMAWSNTAITWTKDDLF